MESFQLSTFYVLNFLLVCGGLTSKLREFSVIYFHFLCGLYLFQHELIDPLVLVGHISSWGATNGLA